ncbi:papain-like cysteine protease family protein [Kitasatospora sp. DSM 101779]|uniref:papain-like cysteine protease family protein n=1 Tax=Kitasatospora sp. DSM 101779 TaxID=2853165 RepID=UPI0021DA89DB|nr:papain-like cysteine protease family protein [Kitasatospora sp. DSM 101779]MCU7823084.1 C39 family peptidase [Kitasatospora sp. DSM 101779]
MPSTPVPPAPGRLRRAVAALALGVLAPALTAAAASPAQAAPVRTPVPAAPASAAGLSAARTLGITMQQQQQSNWCWAASGNTIATYYGYGYSQNQFCNLAFGRAVDSTCPNSQATLGDVQNALWRIGIGQGRYVSGSLSYATVQGEIDAGRPVETRIQWSSGGGHMHVLYGYDAGSNWVYWGDPWPSNYRYNWADHRYYTGNSSFSWTHSLYRISA